MKPKRFFIGQAVTPIKDERMWKCFVPTNPPKDGEIYHVSGYFASRNYEGTWLISLMEMPPNIGYGEKAFAPVELTSEHIAELVEESIKETV